MTRSKSSRASTAGRRGSDRNAGGHQPGAVLAGLDPADPLAEHRAQALGVGSLRDPVQRVVQGRADAGDLDQLGGRLGRLALLVLAGALPYVPGVGYRSHDPGQCAAAEVCLQELHLGVEHVVPAEVKPVQDRLEGLVVVGLGADGEAPDRPVGGDIGVVDLSHAGACRVGLVGVLRAGGFEADHLGAGVGEGVEPADLVGFPLVLDDERLVLAVDDLGEGAVRVRGDRAVGPAGQDLDDRAGGRAGLVALPGRAGRVP